MSLSEPQAFAEPASFAFPRTLYRPVEERDACGTGFVASIAGQRSHGLLRMAVEAVINLTHRGAVSADGKTGDGAGILTQVPYDLLRRELTGMGVRLEPDADLGVGMIFFPSASAARSSRGRSPATGSASRLAARAGPGRPRRQGAGDPAP